MAITRQTGGALVDSYGFRVQVIANEDGSSVGSVTDGTATLEASEEHVGQTGWSQGDIYINPTVTAGAYAAGEVVGGEITLSNFARLSGRGAHALGVTLVDVSNSGPTLDFLLFNAAPTAAIADNAAYAWNAADQAKLVMHFRVDATEWTTIGSQRVCSKALSTFPVLPSGSADLYLYMVTLNAVTFAATTDLHVRFGADRS